MPPKIGRPRTELGEPGIGDFAHVDRRGDPNIRGLTDNGRYLGDVLTGLCPVKVRPLCREER